MTDIPCFSRMGSTRRPAAMRALVAEVAAQHGIGPRDILGEDRRRSIAHPRQEAMYRARHELQQSLPQIGAFFNRDHTTVLHGVREHAKRLAGQ